MTSRLAFTLALGLAASAPMVASASTFAFNFGGGGVNGSVVLTYGAATDAKYGNAYEITGISGTFSDANIGISNASILGLVSLTHSEPEQGNLLAPADFSRFAVASGTSAESGGYATYDNLFWPGGSPATATSYPAAGGYFDIYGLMFRIGDNRVVDIYSNGIFGPPGSAPITYGVAVDTTDRQLDYVSQGVSVTPVPEPATAGLLLGGLGWLAVAARRRKLRS